tara:strand:- start:1758 stop:2303 length:546 start_codon:yes stop_codon:yes gene_type:complete
LTANTKSVTVDGLQTPYATPVLGSSNVPVVTGGYAGEEYLIRTYQEKGAMEGYRANSLTDPDAQYGQPDAFSMYPTAENWQVDFRPWIEASPTNVYTVRTSFYDPQPELETDGSDDETVLRYHSQALVLGTLWLALNERGEEIGEPGNMAQEQYMRALSDAVYTDMNAQAGLGNQMEAWRD